MIVKRSQVHIQGLSLIELMVSMTVALVILAGVVQSFLSSKKAFIYQEEIAYIQENARFAIDTLSREVRQAGHWGCSSGNLNSNTGRANVLRSDFDSLVKMYPIEGFEGGVSSIPTSLSTADNNTDIVILRHANVDASIPVTSHASVGASPTLNTPINHGFDTGTLLVLSDRLCAQSGLFAVSSTTAQTLVHAQDSSTSGNCTTLFRGSFGCADCNAGGTACAGSTIGDYSDGSTVFPLQASAFYIDESSFDPSLPSLHRRFVNGASSSAANITTEELVSGVENMQIQYGVDVDATRDGFANRYVSADAITVDEATAGSGYVGWDRVVSIRLQLVMRSRNEVLPQVNTISYLGVTPVDRFLRQLVTSTIQLRNSVL